MVLPSFAPRQLWLVTIVAIGLIAVIGSVVGRNLAGHQPSPVWVRLVAAVIVTGLVAGAKAVAGPTAAALAGIVGTLLAVVLLVALF